MDATPFASLVDLPADIKKYSPFKPVSHGQFRFTKFNIIDKFGQVVAGIDHIVATSISSQQSTFHSSLFPCLGEAYSLEYLGDGTANAIMKRSDVWNSFVQIPPCVNQPARINASFVTYATPQHISHSWRPVADWENPIQGWVVINFANVSLQIFTNDGRFVREYSVLNGSVAILPFSADTTTANDVPPLLAKLLSKFDASRTYLQSFFQSLATTVQTVQASPSNYAESMLSILGRPLALTIFGVDIELASAPLTDQSTYISTRDPPDITQDYSFSLKIGDGDNVFDGLYALFPEAPVNGNSSLSNFNLDTMYSYHASDSSDLPPILTQKPVYISPSTTIDASSYSEILNGQMQVFAAIVDPFVPVHVYSALLPIKQISFSSWAVENGIKRLASFFKKGPTLVSTDVPAFNPNTEYVIDHDIPFDANTQPQQTGQIEIATVSVGDWNWLQPFKVDEEGTVKYNELGVANPGDKPGWEPAPYVITEGYLQMKKPFTISESTIV